MVYFYFYTAFTICLPIFGPFDEYTQVTAYHDLPLHSVATLAERGGESLRTRERHDGQVKRLEMGIMRPVSLGSRGALPRLQKKTCFFESFYEINHLQIQSNKNHPLVST